MVETPPQKSADPSQGDQTSEAQEPAIAHFYQRKPNNAEVIAKLPMGKEIPLQQQPSLSVGVGESGLEVHILRDGALRDISGRWLKKDERVPESGALFFAPTGAVWGIASDEQRLDDAKGKLRNIPLETLALMDATVKDTHIRRRDLPRCERFYQENGNATPLIFDQKFLEDYELLGRLGGGGQAEVWLAERQFMRGVAAQHGLDEQEGKQLAVKAYVLPPLTGVGEMERAGRQKQIRAQMGQMLSEVNILKDLDHPNVVRLYDARVATHPITDQMALYVVMEYLPSGDLDSFKHERKGYLRGDRFDARLVLRHIEQAALGLQAMHTPKGGKKGLVHLDVKPKNLLLTQEGMVKVTDVGVAGAVGGFDAEEIRGTAVYAAPEQLLGLGDLDQRTDIYQLGITLYELLGGKIRKLGDSTKLIRGTIDPSRLIGTVRDKKMRSYFEQALKETIGGLFIGAADVNEFGTRVKAWDEGIVADLMQEYLRNYEGGVQPHPRVQEVIEHACHPDKEQRYQSIDEFLTDLREAGNKLLTSNELRIRAARKAREPGRRADEMTRKRAYSSSLDLLEDAWTWDVERLTALVQRGKIPYADAFEGHHTLTSLLHTYLQLERLGDNRTEDILTCYQRLVGITAEVPQMRFYEPGDRDAASRYHAAATITKDLMTALGLQEREEFKNAVRRLTDGERVDRNGNLIGLQPWRNREVSMALELEGAKNGQSQPPYSSQQPAAPTNR